MFRVTTNATAAPERIESAIAGYYLVGVEFAAAEGNGRPHPLHVETAGAESSCVSDSPWSRSLVPTP